MPEFGNFSVPAMNVKGETIFVQLFTGFRNLGKKIIPPLLPATERRGVNQCDDMIVTMVIVAISIM